MPSVFTKIIAREIPAHVVYEDDLVIAFLDISQATKGHTLVVSKSEVENVYGLSDELAGHLFRVAARLARAIQKAFSPAGLNVLNNNGAVAGQTVFHFHLHLLPRYEDDDVTLAFVNHMDDTGQEDYKERANLIKAALS
ncbi:MAG: HIT family protein [Acholeplasmataceae bacterium]|nr:MAG: HIT family protein [Acholeplasmataceae bacterium]